MKDKMRDIDLNLLFALDALLRCENVSKAAEDLNMSQSAVSHALKRLRDLFDDALFVRSRDRMVPTPKAVEVSEYVHDIIRLSRGIFLPSAPYDPETSDRSLILALGDVGDVLVLPPLVRYMRQHKARNKIISRAVTSDEAIDQLENGKLDLYIGTMETLSGEILCQKLYEDRLVVITSDKNPLRGSIDFDQYSAMDHIMISSRMKSISTLFVDSIFSRNDLKRNVRIETPNIISVIDIIDVDENLCATVPYSMLKYFNRSSNINILEPEFTLPSISINQYWHRRYNKDRFLSYFRNAIYNIFRASE